MVRSNSVSGVPALFESLDSRQLFASSLPTVGADPTFAANGKFAAVFFGGEEIATHVVGLQDGGALVGGDAYDLKHVRHTVLAKFKADGTLDKAFDGDGKLVLAGAVDRRLGGIGDLQLDKSGRMLVIGGAAISRLKADGTFDSAFGNGGYTAAGGQAVVLRNGTLRAASLDTKKNLLRVTDFTSDGVATGAYTHKTVTDKAKLLTTTTAEVLAYPDGTVRQYTPTAAVDTAFGTNGTLNTMPSFNKFAKANGPWSFDGGDAEHAVRVPDDYNVQRIGQTKDGYVLTGATDLLPANNKNAPSFTKYGRYTTIYTYVGQTGSHVTVDAGTLDGKRLKAADFRPFDGGDQPFGGTFTLPGGKQVYYDPITTDGSGLSMAYAAAPAGDGKYYVVGKAYGPLDDGKGTYLMGFSVTRSAAII